jgi:UDP-N-acetylmuramyl pentapeptide phosphotransferase/UDP-N-acetylglucosamine-1-phosphate transferase
MTSSLDPTTQLIKLVSVVAVTAFVGAFTIPIGCNIFVALLRRFIRRRREREAICLMAGLLFAVGSPLVTILFWDAVPNPLFLVSASLFSLLIGSYLAQGLDPRRV